MKAYLDFWKRWNDFQGRTSRCSFWVALGAHILLNTLLQIGMAIVSVSLLRLTPETAMTYSHQLRHVFAILWCVAVLAMTVRRLRDAGYTAKSLLWLFVPFIGFVAIVARLCAKSVD